MAFKRCTYVKILTVCRKLVRSMQSNMFEMNTKTYSGSNFLMLRTCLKKKQKKTMRKVSSEN